MLEADVYYTTQDYSVWDYYIEWWLWKDSTTYREKKDGYAYLTYSQDVTHKGEGWWGAGTYTWDRIETVEQFIAENDITQNVYSGSIFNVTVANKITDEGKKSLENKQWVLRFLETPFSISTISQTHNDLNGTMVGDVSILRLKFETDGEVYNLGVVDNKQTGSSKPINDEKLKLELTDTGKLILLIAIVIIVLLLIIVLSVIFPPVWSIVKTIGKGIKSLLLALWWLIKLPFRGLKALIDKIRDR